MPGKSGSLYRAWLVSLRFLILGHSWCGAPTTPPRTANLSQSERGDVRAEGRRPGSV